MSLAVHRRLIVYSLLVTVLAGLVLGGCGKSGEEPSPAPDYASKLAGSPAPLASLHEQGNELLPGGLDAFNDRIATLKGFPVVVNVWASWCGPCQAEFPYFQQVSARMGKRVAFLGVNSEDSDDAARTFLSDHQVPYPNYIDHDRDIADDLGGVGFPRTAFYDASGELTFVHSGQFPDQASLEEAIDEYAVKGQSG